MAVKPAVVHFYVDADVLGLAKVLARLRTDVTFPGDPGASFHRRLRPACPINSTAVEDEVWIPETARQGWLIITRDRAIQDNRAEILAVRDHGARMVTLASPRRRRSGVSWRSLCASGGELKRCSRSPDPSSTRRPGPDSDRNPSGPDPLRCQRQPLVSSSHRSSNDLTSTVPGSAPAAASTSQSTTSAACASVISQPLRRRRHRRARPTQAGRARPRRRPPGSSPWPRTCQRTTASSRSRRPPRVDRGRRCWPG